MGYEIKFIVCEKVENMYENIVEYNYCKPNDSLDYNIEKYGKSIENKVCVMDEITKTDKYGSTIKELSLKQAIKLLESEIKKSEYRRNLPLLMLLNGFELNKEKWENIVVLVYGY